LGVSLYRTWRPLVFADLVGQDSVVRTLTKAIESGKLAHAYLFSGPRGSGKTSAAKILARCINCVNGPTATPDNTCDNCRAMLAGTALDVLEIDAASNRGIDEIRSLRDAVKFAPASMRMKVYIIDEAHMLTKEGANAFLKTLEEPPPHAVFILATTEPEKLPATVLSRCQRYAFARIAIGVMIDKMREIAAGERITIDDAALAAIAYRADGGLRDALTMLEQAAAFAGGQAVTVETLDLAFGATGREFAETLLDATLARDASAALGTIEKASDAGTDMQLLLRTLIAGFRNLLVARVDAGLLRRDLAAEDARRVTERAAGITQASIVRALRLLTDALSLARTGGNARLELETALLRLILVGEDPTLDALSSRIAALEARPGPAPEPPAAVTPPPKAGRSARETTSLQKIRAAWQSIRAKVESERQSLRAPLSRAAIDALDGDELVLRLPDAWSADALRDYAPLIESAIADVLNCAVRVTLRVDGSAKTRSAAPDDAEALFDYANQRIKRKS
jgi:DNA polymerase III subunit gamma/tau